MGENTAALSNELQTTSKHYGMANDHLSVVRHASENGEQQDFILPATCGSLANACLAMFQNASPSIKNIEVNA